MELVIQSMVSLVGALSGAAFGAYFAVNKLRNETAFARRLSWCEKAIRAFNVAGASLVSAQEAPPVAIHDAEACWTEAIQCYEKLIPLCGQKDMYASPDGIKAINNFMAAFHELIEMHLAGHSNTKMQDKCSTCLEQLKEAGIILGKEARKHLGLSKLPAELISSENKFTGSFRGRVLFGHEQEIKTTDISTK